jgi:hypothetical protein
MDRLLTPCIEARACHKVRPTQLVKWAAKERLDEALRSSERIQPQHGRITVGQHSLIYRWCFDDLSVARAFVEQFGGEFCKAGF